MEFTFSEDQLQLYTTAHNFLLKEVTTAKIRALWESPTGRSKKMWKKMADMGLCAVTVPEQYGGLGLGVVEFILLAQGCGYVALPEPLVNTVLVSVPLLRGLDNNKLKERWLPQLVAGEANVAVGLQENILVEDAHVSDLLLLQYNDEIHALLKEDVEINLNESIDPSRKLFTVQWEPNEKTCVASGKHADRLINTAFNAGALGCAAQALGLAMRVLDLAVQYSCERHQFGKPIGSFQAIKHLMSDIVIGLEHAKAPVYRAAFSLENSMPLVNVHVSHAKLSACNAAMLAAKNAMQVHGAMGYTWDVDLHIYIKKIWSLNNAWGDEGFHKRRVADMILSNNAKVGAGQTF